MTKYIECGRKGIYFLLDGTTVVYIGSTSSFPRRILAHYDKRFDRIRFIECDDNLIYERRWIKRFNPKYNIITMEHGKRLCSLGYRDKTTSKFLNGY